MEPVKRTSVQKKNKNEIYMARAKNSNCLNFCTQVDHSKKRNAVYFFLQIFSRKTNFSLSPSRIDESGHNTASKKNNLQQIASNLWWNITALKAELPHVLLSVLFAVDRNKTGKP